jgi:beta-galactosidase
VGRKGGEVVCEYEVITAGPAARLQVSADRAELAADALDVAHLTLQVLDAQGNPVPEGDNLVRWSVQGPARLLGTDNGNPACHDSFLSPERRAFHGLCLAIVQTTALPGEIVVRAEADGLEPATISLRSHKPHPVAFTQVGTPPCGRPQRSSLEEAPCSPSKRSLA